MPDAPEGATPGDRQRVIITYFEFDGGWQFATELEPFIAGGTDPTLTEARDHARSAIKFAMPGIDYDLFEQMEDGRAPIFGEQNLRIPALVTPEATT